MLTAYRSTLYSERTDSINLFLLHISWIQKAHKTELCEKFQEEKYLFNEYTTAFHASCHSADT
jgi:hypothetical protein